MAPCNGCGGDSLQDAMASVGFDPPKAHVTRTDLRLDVRSVTHLARLDAEQRRWINTKYRENRRRIGHGVDCRNLVAGILENLWRTSIDLPKTPQDAGLHDPKAVIATARAIRRSIPSTEHRPGDEQPGDVLMVAGERHGEASNHIAMMAADGVRVIDAVRGVGARWTSLAALPPVLRIYRPDWSTLPDA